MKSIDPQRLYDSRTITLQNAKEMLSDAKLLFESERWARCFFLLQIATEELGKYGIIVSSAISLKHGSLSTSKFLKRFRNHKEKTKNLLGFENLKTFLESEGKSDLFRIEQDNKYAELQEQVKFMSIYTDFDEGGTLHIPSQLFGRDLCSVTISLLQSRIGLIQSFEDEVASSFDFSSVTCEMIAGFYDRIGLSEVLKKKRSAPLRLTNGKTALARGINKLKSMFG